MSQNQRSIGQQLFSGKRITLMGLGVLGRGLGDAKFLAEAGADLIVTDLKRPEELQSSIKEIEHLPNIKLILGEHRLEDFRGRDLIIKGANVPFDSPYIQEAQNQKIRVTMSTALFAKYARTLGVKIIGITGTRGKSTTTHLLFEILKRASVGSMQIFLGGNIQSVATLPFLNKIKNGDIAVLELDSWQLQGFKAETISPHLSIFTNFFPDHLNYYQGDIGRYLNDKANIFLYQTSADHLIIGDQVENLIREKYGAKLKSRITITHATEIPEDWKIKLPGEHNRRNISLVLKACQELKIDQQIVKQAVENFRGVSGRLELIREINGVKIYNDTTATTPEATLAGLTAVAKNKKAILIMGGTDKNLGLAKLAENLSIYCKEIILLPGTGTEKLLATVGKNFTFKPVSSLKEAVDWAISLTQPGEVILFSPAFASFGLPPGGFKNEFERGAQFDKLIKKLGGKKEVQKVA